MRSLLGTALAAAAVLLSGMTVPAESAARPPALSAHDASVGEAAGAVALVRITLARKHGRVTVRWRTEDGTARAGADFVATRGKLRFGTKQRTKTIAVRLLDDRTTEPAETFDVVLHRARGAKVKVRTAEVTIAANDVPPPPEPNPVLTVARSGPGAGHVRTDPEIEGLDYCNVGSIAGCSVAVPRGTAVSVWIEPDSLSTFDGWTSNSPGCSGTDPCAVVVNADTTLTAVMTALPGTFVARVVGPGHLSISGALDDGCNDTFTFCTGSIEYGGPDATVTVHKDDPGDVVVWSGDAPCAQDAPSCTIRAGRELVATIVPPTVPVTVTGTGGGTGTVTGAGLSCTYTAGVLTGTCSSTVPTGVSTTITASPSSGTKLMHLSAGSCSGAGEFHTPVSCTFAPTSAVTVSARFEPA